MASKNGASKSVEDYPWRESNGDIGVKVTEVEENDFYKFYNNRAYIVLTVPKTKDHKLQICIENLHIWVSKHCSNIDYQLAIVRAEQLAKLVRNFLFLYNIRDSGFGIRDSGFGIRDSGFGIRDSGFGIRDSGFGIRDSGFGIRDSGFGIRDSGFGIRDSGFGIRDSGFGIRDSGFGIRDSGFGIRDAGCGMRGKYVKEVLFYCEKRA
ncbi:hypothetical protein QZH41_007745 [Actinostola sp. cb2023]|nr:hypothetical protein QZH41_007745 [Actinostola sp. cb2023]